MSDLLPEIPKRPLKSKSGSPDISIDKNTQGTNNQSDNDDDDDDGFSDSDGIDSDSDDGDEHRVSLDPESPAQESNSLDFLKTTSSSKIQEESIIPSIPPRPTTREKRSIDIPIVPKRPSAKSSLKSGNSSKLDLPTTASPNNSTEVLDSVSVDNAIVDNVTNTEIPSIPKRPSSKSGNSSKLDLSTPAKPDSSTEELDTVSVDNAVVDNFTNTEIPSIPKRPSSKSVKSSKLDLATPAKPDSSNEELDSVSGDNTVVDNFTNTEIPSIPKRPSRKAKETTPVDLTQTIDSSFETSPEIPTIPQRPKRVSDAKLESNDVEDDGSNEPIFETSQVSDSEEVSPEIPTISEKPKASSSSTPKVEAEDSNTNELEEVKESIPSIPERPETLSKLDGEVEDDKPVAQISESLDSSNNEAPLQLEADDKEEKPNTTSPDSKPIELEPELSTESSETVSELKDWDEPAALQSKEQTTNESVPIIPKRPAKKPASIDTETTTATAEPISRSTTTPSLGQTSEFPAVKKSATESSIDPSSVTDEILDIYGAESPVQTKLPEPLPAQNSGNVSKKAPPPPPKPKKPSSRILAFQQQLMASQKETLENRHIVPSHRPKPPSRASTSSSIVSGGNDDDSSKEDLPEVPKSRPTKKQTDFAKNLNGLLGGVALPGMVLPGQFNSNISTTRDSNADEEQVKDVRRSRAKGPRGRKLPTAATEPVITNESKFKIYVADAWEVKTALETTSTTTPLKEKPIEDFAIDGNGDSCGETPIQEESETNVDNVEGETIDGIKEETIDETKQEAIDEIPEGQANDFEGQTTDETENNPINESRQIETEQETIDGTKGKTVVEPLQTNIEGNPSSDTSIIAPTEIDMSENSEIADKASANDSETIEVHEDNDNKFEDADGNAAQEDVFYESSQVETLAGGETADE